MIRRIILLVQVLWAQRPWNRATLRSLNLRPGTGRAPVPSAYVRHPIQLGQLVLAVSQGWHPAYPKPTHTPRHSYTGARHRFAAAAA